RFAKASDGRSGESGRGHHRRKGRPRAAFRHRQGGRQGGAGRAQCAQAPLRGGAGSLRPSAADRPEDRASGRRRPRQGRARSASLDDRARAGELEGGIGSDGALRDGALPWRTDGDQGRGMNIQKMMQQAQAMQAKMDQELSALKVEATSGGGMVKIEMSGKKEILSVVIDKTVVDPQDVETLQDLVLAAAREA